LQVCGTHQLRQMRTESRLPDFEEKASAQP
jgi:hypothetical protein